jgi:prolipoprotein diacylglyceryltransferase
MIIHINTDYSFIPPYSVTLFLSVFFGITGLFILNIKRGIAKNISGYLIMLSTMMCVCFGIMPTRIASGGKEIGFSSMGGLFGMYAAVLIISIINGKRDDTKKMFENCTLILPLMYSVSKFGCFLAGCCHGIEYSGIFCVEYTGGNIKTVSYFPVQLTESVIFMIIFVYGIMRLCRKKKNTGIFILISSAVTKGLLDFLRFSHIDKIISINQTLCLIILIIGIILLKFNQNKNSIGQ